METTLQSEKRDPSIQLTLFDYFMDSENFTLKEAVEAVKAVKEVKEPSVRGRIYEGIEKGLFVRVEKGVYQVKRKDKTGKENTCLLINGDGRDLSFLPDKSVDAIITDHPYLLDKSLKGGNRDFANYESYQYENRDFAEKQRVLKPGCFLVEFLPEENGDNYQYIYEVKELARKNGLEYYATVPWKKGDFVANTGRKSKNTENIVFFTKGKARDMRLDMKKIGNKIENPVIVNWKSSEGMSSDDIEFNLIVSKKDEKSILRAMDMARNEFLYENFSTSIMLLKYEEEELLDAFTTSEYIEEYLSVGNYKYLDMNSPEFEQGDYYMSGAKGMLPTVFDVDPVPKKEKIHQAEKPVELLEEIIQFITKEDELILDQNGGSAVTGVAAINKNRNSIIIEKDEQTYEKAKERLNDIQENESAVQESEYESLKSDKKEIIKEGKYIGYTAKISPVENENVKAYVTLEIGSGDIKYQCTQTAIIERKDKTGMFVSFPSIKTDQVDSMGKAVYKNMYYPVQKDFYEELTSEILAAYKDGRNEVKVVDAKNTVNVAARLQNGNDNKRNANVTLNGVFTVNSIQVSEKEDGTLTLNMPRTCLTSSNKGVKETRSVFTPITENAKTSLKNAVEQATIQSKKYQREK